MSQVKSRKRRLLIHKGVDVTKLCEDSEPYVGPFNFQEYEEGFHPEAKLDRKETEGLPGHLDIHKYHGPITRIREYLGI